MSLDETQPETMGVVIETSGARDTLQRLLSDLDEALPQSGFPEKPIWILASSSALRHEIIQRILAHRGTTLGVVVHNLHSASLTVLQRMHESRREQNTLADIWIRRESRKDPGLHALLGAFDDDFAVVKNSVMDLLEAGIGPTLEDPLMECMSAAPAGSQRDRAMALMRVALQVDHILTENAVSTSAGLAGHAAPWIASHPSQALESQQIFVVGFSDTHAHGGDFLTALLRQTNTRIYLELPDDPAIPGRVESGRLYAQRTHETLQGAATRIENRQAANTQPELDAFHAYGATEEIREVARRVNSLLQQGVTPEHIGIVSRQLEPYMLPIRHHMHDLGIPFSMQREPLGVYPLHRHFLAVQNLLTNGENTSTDDWLDALCPGETTLNWWNQSNPHATRADIREGLRILGISTLGDVPSLLARLSPGGNLKLASRNGRVLDDGGARSRRRSLPHQTLHDIVQSAQTFLERTLPEVDSLSNYLESIRSVFTDTLGWKTAPEGTPWIEALDRLNDFDDLSPSYRYQEVLLLIEEATKDISLPKAPGNRGGIRVLDAASARGLTFEHLFLIGMNRNEFPRVIKEDPLLPDNMRMHLLPILPDLAIKKRGHDEERFLFAQLLSSSEKVSISWKRCDDDGKEKARSVFVERLQIANPSMPVADIPRDRADSLSGTFAGGLGRPRSARDMALLAALTQPRSQLDSLLSLPFRESLTRLDQPETNAQSLAHVRLRILEEAEPTLAHKEGRKRAQSSGPYLGFVGIAPSTPETPIYVTALEDLSRCPWQFFMKRVLRIEQPPEAGRLPPALTERMIGNVAHNTLEFLVENALSSQARTVSEALSHGSTPVPKPTKEAVTATLKETAKKVANEEGIYVEGLIDLLALLSRPSVERFLDWDWPQTDSQRDVYGTELEGQCLLRDHEGRQRILAFKADRVEAQDGKVLFTDLKSGKPISDKIKESTRRGHLAKKAQQGGALQLLAYAGSPSNASEARYLYGAEHVPEHARELRIEDDDPLIQSTFSSITSAAIEAYDRGLCFPRLSEPEKNKTPTTCDWCSLREACTQGDSGARRRLLKIAELSRLPEGDESAALFHHLWFYKSVDEEEAS